MKIAEIIVLENRIQKDRNHPPRNYTLLIVGSYIIICADQEATKWKHITILK